MTLEQFKKLVKDWWTNDLDDEDNIPDEYEDDIFPLTDKYSYNFYNSIYTPAIDKDVEAIWLRRNTKLGRALL